MSQYQHIKDHPKDNCILDKEWTLDDVENYVEEIYITGLFEPYDEYKMP